MSLDQHFESHNQASDEPRLRSASRQAADASRQATGASWLGPEASRHGAEASREGVAASRPGPEASREDLEASREATEASRKEPEALPEPYVFDLDGGRACLDFANTLGASAASTDHLTHYVDLVAFATQSSLI